MPMQQGSTTDRVRCTPVPSTRSEEHSFLPRDKGPRISLRLERFVSSWRLGLSQLWVTSLNPTSVPLPPRFQLLTGEKIGDSIPTARNAGLKLDFESFKTRKQTTIPSERCHKEANANSSELGTVVRPIQRSVGLLYPLGFEAQDKDGRCFIRSYVSSSFFDSRIQESNAMLGVALFRIPTAPGVGRHWNGSTRT